MLRVFLDSYRKDFCRERVTACWWGININNFTFNDFDPCRLKIIRPMIKKLVSLHSCILHVTSIRVCQAIIICSLAKANSGRPQFERCEVETSEADIDRPRISNNTKYYVLYRDKITALVVDGTTWKSSTIKYKLCLLKLQANKPKWMECKLIFWPNQNILCKYSPRSHFYNYIFWTVQSS